MMLQVRRLASGDDDAHGNSAVTLTAPQPWEVWGVAPGSMREVTDQRDLSDIEWSVLAPPSDQTPTERDVVIFQGVEYAVNGRPQDYTHGPWPHPTAGVVVELRRVEG